MDDLKAVGKILLDAWRSPNRRPIWQMVLLLPLFLIYWPARRFVDWMDRGF